MIPHMTHNSMKEKLRTAHPFGASLVNFCDLELSLLCWAMSSGNRLEELGVKHPLIAISKRLVWGMPNSLRRRHGRCSRVGVIPIDGLMHPISLRGLAREMKFLAGR